MLCLLLFSCVAIVDVPKPTMITIYVEKNVKYYDNCEVTIYQDNQSIDYFDYNSTIGRQDAISVAYGSTLTARFRIIHSSTYIENGTEVLQSATQDGFVWEIPSN